MKKVIISVILSMFIISCNIKAKQEETKEPKNEAKTNIFNELPLESIWSYTYENDGGLDTDSIIVISKDSLIYISAITGSSTNKYEYIKDTVLIYSREFNVDPKTDDEIVTYQVNYYVMSDKYLKSIYTKVRQSNQAEWKKYNYKDKIIFKRN